VRTKAVAQTAARCCTDLRAASGAQSRRVLFAPFGSGAAHIVIFRPVSPGRPVPGRTEKCRYRTDGAAEKGGEDGGGERKRHVTLRAKR
jgi:hypothetical protein